MKNKIKVWWYNSKLGRKYRSITDAIDHLLWKIKDYDRLDEHYAFTLAHATGNNLSKNNYTKEVVKEAIDGYQEIIHEDYIKSDLSEYIKENDFEGLVDYVNKLKEL